MMEYVLIGLAVLIILFVIIAMSKSNEFKISRSLVIKAPAETIFEQINSSRNFNAWNPWMKADPDAKVTYEGPEMGVGASYSWNGKRTGMGTDTIIESIPHQKVVVRLDFKKPMMATNEAAFTLTPVDEGTEVEWSMWGPRNFVTKMMHTVFNMEKMIGTSFDSGLQNLNEIVTHKSNTK